MKSVSIHWCAYNIKGELIGEATCELLGLEYVNVLIENIKSSFKIPPMRVVLDIAL